MPELPEVQTTVKGLQTLIYKEISKIKIYSTKLRYNIPKKTPKILKNNKIIGVSRVGKYIVVDLLCSNSLIFHLGMSGRLRILKKNKFILSKHDHFVMYLQKNTVLIFNDPRKFGFIDISETKNIFNKDYFKRLGKDALDKNFNSQYLQKKIKNSVVPIKQILLNQRIVSGIGNIYANEILFDAKISPFISGIFLNANKKNNFFY